VENHSAKVKTGLALRDLKIETETWPVAGSFRISRSSLTEIAVVTVTLCENGHTGRGECRPYTRYKETPSSVTAQIESIREQIESGLRPEDLQNHLPAGAARNAVDCAMWDLKAKQSDCIVAELLGIPPARPRKTAFTLSIDTPEKMQKAAIKAKAYPLLKVKIGGIEGLESCLAVMQARPDAELIIDANEALKPDDLASFQSKLKNKPVVMIEQPLADALSGEIPHAPKALPIFCADESLHTAKDIDRLWQEGYRAVNVKLDKCGGLTEGLDLMRAAKAKGFIIMAGCMVGTSLAMAPIMTLESFADYIDLDGPLLLSQDRKKGLLYEGPIIHPPMPELWG
jgi:L-alanine-DL-glutamate epimerase-like enolase superfamily enzyme